MIIRRAVAVAAAAVISVLGLVAPAMAASPSYPPTNPILRIDKTLVRVGGTATATVSQCKPNSTATITVTGPGRAPGSTPSSYPITIDGSGNASQVLTFTRLGRNTVTLNCFDANGNPVTASLFVTVAAAPGSGGGGVIGDDASKGGGTAGSTDTAGLGLAGLAATGARLVGPLLLGAALLGLGGGLVLLSRRRRRSA